MDGTDVVAIAGVAGTLIAGLGGVAFQGWWGRRQAREERLWAERMAAYHQAALVAERLDTEAFNLTKPTVRTKGWGVDALPEAGAVREVSARMEIVAPPLVRAAWASVVAADRTLRDEVQAWLQESLSDEYEPGWPEDHRVLALVRHMVRSFREAVRADVGNRS